MVFESIHVYTADVKLICGGVNSDREDEVAFPRSAPRSAKVDQGLCVGVDK
jgi:hypothetical protein